MADIMLDLETLGTSPGCVIRSIGACAFEPGGDGVVDRTLYVIVNRASCEAAGLCVDPETEAWWNDQSPEARAEFDGHGVELATALDLFDAFYREHTPPAELKSDKLWCNGPSFDETILGAAYRALGRKTPWRYNAARDCRTIFDLTGLKLRHTKGVFHKADDDAKEQALLVQEAWRMMFGGWSLGDLSENERQDLTGILAGIRRAYQGSRRKADQIAPLMVAIANANLNTLGDYRQALLSHAISAAADIKAPEGTVIVAPQLRELSMRMAATDMVHTAAFLIQVTNKTSGDDFDPHRFALAALAIAENEDAQWNACQTADATADEVPAELEAAQ